MMWLLETMKHYLQYKIYHSKYYLQRYFETCPIVSNITTNCPKAYCKYLWKNQKYLLIKVHGNMCTQPSPCEQAQAKNTSRRQRRVGKQPLFIPNQKKQLGTHTRERSLWGWTKGCPISFLSPSAWREQCPRAITSVEVKRMKGLHHLPQYCTSRRRGAKTKLSKLQQIDAINVKKRSRRDSCTKPMNPKGEKN